MKVSQAMTTAPEVVTDEASLADAARIMWNRDCGVVPVVTEARGEVCGIITDRDVCMGGLTQNQPLDRIPVTVSMTRDVQTCRPGDTLTVALGVMRKKQLRRLAVVDEKGKLKGVLSLKDIAVKAKRARGAAKAKQEGELAKTLEALSERPAKKTKKASGKA